MSDPKERQVHGPNWYLSLYRANDELRCNSHRIVLLPIVGRFILIDSCVVQLIRTIKRARMFQVRKQRELLEKLKSRFCGGVNSELVLIGI